jgi:hypothetical protein
MSIRIENLSVNGLGPITSLKWQFKDMNLIYGRNEQGKTYLVEYLLRSLFKNAQNTRDLTDSGQVNVSGLAKEIIRFDPKSRKKIEDFLFPGVDVKPVDFSRLCVVKGGELTFLPNNEKTITKGVLKDYLSDQRILDVIQKEISATIQESTWENGEINGSGHRGEIKKLYDELHQKMKIDELLREITDTYSMGEVNKLRREKEKNEQLINQQKLARRVYAYKLAEQIKAKESELQYIPSEDLVEVGKLFTLVENKRDQIKENQAQIKNLEPRCEHYLWMETAITECENRPEAFSSNMGLLFMILTIIATAISTVFAFLGSPFVSLGTGFLAILFVIIAILQYRSRLRSSVENAEVKRIFNDYEFKFNEKVHSISALISKRDGLKDDYYKLKNLNDQLVKDKEGLSEFEKNLKIKLETLVRRKIVLKDIKFLVDTLQRKRNELDKQLRNLQIDLGSLQVKPEEYMSEVVEAQYNPTALNEYEQQKEEFIEMISKEENMLITLKKRVCDVTGDNLDADWEEIIDRLRIKREVVSQSFKNLKAQIGSGILITQVIKEMRTQEDESITRALDSDAMQEPIHAIAHNYDGVELEGNEIIAYNQYQRFPLGNLSTGAQEQVLLALRIGIATHILRDQKMFLILDDAFQHSDWERREWLVDEMADLVSIGWQIIYFSMDDHIKMLFEERIKPKLKDRYQTFELKSAAL